MKFFFIAKQCKMKLRMDLTYTPDMDDLKSKGSIIFKNIVFEQVSDVLKKIIIFLVFETLII